MVLTNKEIFELKTKDFEKLIGMELSISLIDNSSISGKLSVIKISPSDFSLPTDIVLKISQNEIEIGLSKITKLEY